MLSPVCLSIPYVAAAENSVIELNDEILDGKPVGRSLRFLKDPDERYSMDDLLHPSPEIESQFFQVDKDSPNFGISDSPVYWARFEVENPGPARTVFIEYDYHHADFVDFHYPQASGDYAIQSGGDRVESIDALMRFMFAPAFKITVPPSRSVWLMRVKSQGSIPFRVLIKSEAVFQETTFIRSLMIYGVMGAIAIMVFYNLFLSFSLKSRPYFLYSVMTFFSLLSYAISSGQTQLISSHPLRDYMANEGYSIIPCLTFAFALIFSSSFLDLKKISPGLHKTFMIMCGLFVAVAILVHFHRRPATILLTTLMYLATCIGLASSGLYLSFRRYRPAYFYTVAWSSLLGSQIIYNSAILGLVKINVLTENAHYIGGVVEAILLSLALGAKMNDEQRQASQTITQLNQSLEEKNEDLRISLEIEKKALEREQKAKVKLDRFSKNLQAEVERQTEELRSQHEILLSQKQELIEMDRQKTTFFQNISHELRTPLTLMMFPLGQLSKEIPHHSGIGMLSRNTERLHRLVNQILDFQKITSPDYQPTNHIPVDVLSILKACVSYFEEASTSKGVKVKLDHAGHERIVVKGTVDYLEKIFFNYLSNALKYAPSSSTILVEAALQDERARIAIKDQGKGIPKEQQSTLFKAFSQVADGSQQRFDSTGLGLALARELATAMQGEVGVESELDRGATFWLELPIHDVEKPIVDVLFVDDEPAVRYHIEDILMRGGIATIETAESVVTAKDILNRKRVRCLITDANMPGAEDGIDLLRYIAKVQPDCKRLMITGTDSNELLTEIVNAKLVERFYRKPFDIAQILPDLQQWIRESPVKDDVTTEDSGEGFSRLRTHMTLSHEENDSSDSQDAQEGMPEAPLVLVIDDIADMRKIIREVLQDQGYRVATAGDGLAGIEAAQTHQPDLIITDWMMPRLSGPELIQKLKLEKDLGSIPTVLLTAKNDQESKLQGTQIGANAYLGKPFDRLELISTVENLLQLKTREREIQKLNQYLTDKVLARFLPPRIIDDVLTGKLSLDSSPSIKSITVMFTDLCSFTRTSETLGANKIARILNSYMERMTQVVFEYEGMIDKFIGDGIMIVFGYPIELPFHEQIQRAMACAHKMNEALRELNREWEAQELPPFVMKIGIHSGPATAGIFGGAQRSELTVIGPTVNMAARIAAAANAGEILFSGFVRDCLSESGWEAAGTVELKDYGSTALYRSNQNALKAA
nr:response regulator [Oligoflexus tunisiensis]